jgi:hypothetical protein
MVLVSSPERVIRRVIVRLEYDRICEWNAERPSPCPCSRLCSIADARLAGKLKSTSVAGAPTPEIAPSPESDYAH